MRRTRMRILATAVVLVGAIVAVALTRSPARGPYYSWQSDGGYNGITAYVKPGQVLASGVVDLPAQPTPVLLLGVRPLHPAEARGVTLRYAVSAEEGVPGHGVLFGSRNGWHPRRWALHPVAGFVVPPHKPGAIVVGISSTKPGIHPVLGFIVDYRIGLSTYSAPQQVGVQICIKTRRCPYAG